MGILFLSFFNWSRPDVFILSTQH